jgi:pimeloyl-ACP methyl ester carboxylesterase
MRRKLATFSKSPVVLWILLAALAATSFAEQDPLRRRAAWGAALGEPSASKPGAEVLAIRPGGPADKAGLQKGDLILSIDGKPLPDALTYGKVNAALRGGDSPTLVVRRGNETTKRQITLDSYPKEQLEGVDEVYGAVASEKGYRLRTITTRPQGAAGKLPAVLFVGWLSCDSIEYPIKDAADGWGRVLHRIAETSGMVLMRVDRPGVGDSEGPACADATFDDDLAAHRAALKALRQDPGVDPNAIFLFGGSMGGAMAPLLAAETPVRGLVIWGAWSKTWLEHMIELERRRLTLSGQPPGEVNRQMGGYVELHSLILDRKMTPAEAARQRPDLAKLWYDAPGHLYGRPLAFFQGAQAANIAAAWEKIDAPVLVQWGEYDWIMSHDDHQLIADIVNRKHPGRATFQVRPKTDHHFSTFDSLQASFNGDGGKPDATVADPMIQFIKGVLQAK